MLFLRISFQWKFVAMLILSEVDPNWNYCNSSCRESFLSNLSSHVDILEHFVLFLLSLCPFNLCTKDLCSSNLRSL